MSYIKYCCDCEMLDRKKESTDFWSGSKKYYCKAKGEYVKINDNQCNSFKEAKKNDGYTPAGCYITTMVCDVLGYSDDCDLLCTLRNFREKYLKNHPEYIKLLLEYDIVGPQISGAIRNCEGNYEICSNVFMTYLIPCIDAIRNSNYDEAIGIYRTMVETLIERFEIVPEMVTGNEEYNIDTLGKGRVRTKKASD